MSRRLPWMKFNGSDWRQDVGLRRCGPAARGLWIEMVIMLDASEVYGVLTANGKPMTSTDIGIAAGWSRRTVEPLLGELERNGVFSRDENGAIYSRRMIRDEERALQDIANGKKGGNPKIVKAAAAQVAAHSTPTGAPLDAQSSSTGAPAGAQSTAKSKTVTNDNNELPGFGVNPDKEEDKEQEEDKKESVASLPLRASPAPKPDYLEGFETWWSEYPRKVAKEVASKAYARIVKSGVSPADLLTGLRGWAPRFETAKDRLHFNPHPATWLNQKRWLDEVPHDDVARGYVSTHKPRDGDWARGLDVFQPISTIRVVDKEDYLDLSPEELNQ